MASEQRADNYTNGSQEIAKFYSSKILASQNHRLLRRKKGITDNAMPEITKRITKEYLGLA